MDWVLPGRDNQSLCQDVGGTGHAGSRQGRDGVEGAVSLRVTNPGRCCRGGGSRGAVPGLCPRQAPLGHHALCQDSWTRCRRSEWGCPAAAAPLRGTGGAGAGWVRCPPGGRAPRPGLRPCPGCPVRHIPLSSGSGAMCTRGRQSPTLGWGGRVRGERVPGDGNGNPRGWGWESHGMGAA